MSLTIGDVIEGKYRIGRIIGEGGMGAVYEGENLRIQRRVAIKVLHAAFTENREVVQRFEREAQAAGRIGNDHILEVLDLGTLPDGDLFLVMEFLDGEPLSKRIQRAGRLMPEEAIPIIRQVLVGLRAAHAAGIVHRDLKPDNVFILREKAGRPDFVKIIDFGISKFQPLGGELRMTKTGAMMGTPYYMSPEQATGSAEVDSRSDIYAVGVILYEAVTGAVPFDAPSFNQLLFKIALEAPRPPHEVAPYLDTDFCAIIARGMAREAVHRFQSTDEFAAALDGWMTGRATGSLRHYAATGAIDATVALPLTTPVHSPSNPGTPFTPVHPTPGPATGMRPLGLTPAEPARTGGAWSATGAPPTRSRAALWISMGVGAALLVVGIGVFTVVRATRAPQPQAASALSAETVERAQASSAPPPVAVAPAAAQPAALPVEPAPVASRAPAPAAPARPHGVSTATPVPVAAAPAPAHPPAAPAAPVAAAPVAVAPAPPPPPSPPPAAAPAGKPAPDFGY